MFATFRDCFLQYALAVLPPPSSFIPLTFCRICFEVAPVYSHVEDVHLVDNDMPNLSIIITVGFPEDESTCDDQSIDKSIKGTASCPVRFLISF